MSDPKAPTGSIADIRATTDNTIERKVNAVPVDAAIPTVRPWTAAFLLPSIRSHDPKST